MFLRRFTSCVLGRLAWRDLHRSGSHYQIFVIHAFSTIVHFYRPIFSLIDQGLGLGRPIALILRLQLQKMPPVLHHPIVADPSLRL
jgi:hypothetical protein